MQENVYRSSVELPSFYGGPSPGSQSAPIFPDKKFDPSERIKVLRPSSTRKFHTYVLPTPTDAKQPVSTRSVSPVSTARFDHKLVAPTQLYHSSPLEPYKFFKNSGDDHMSGRTQFPKAHTTTVLRESNTNTSPLKMPPPFLGEPPTTQFNPHTGSDTKKIKRYAFSGPITSRPWSNKPNATDFMPSGKHPHAASAMPAHVRTSRPSLSPKASPNISPPPMKSPTISELHELPRPPPIGSARATRPASLIGHSAPLVYRGPEVNKISKSPPFASHTASPLPTPPATVHRSFSIPSRRTPLSPVAKFLEDPNNTSLTGEVASPPLTPISLLNSRPTSQASESVTRATKS